MTATFLLIRHAAHIHLDRIFSGRLPAVPLSNVGRAQAQRLATSLSSEPIDRIIASPLDRTRETAQAIGDARGLPVQTDPALLEIDLGDWTGRTLDGFGDDPEWRAWNTARGTARIPGGETMAEATGRIVGLLDRLAREPADTTIAIVSHSDMIRGAVAHVLGLPLDHLLRFDIHPASVTRVVWGGWGAKLMSLNERGGA